MVDPVHNTLRLLTPAASPDAGIPRQAVTSAPARAVLDVGEHGRLLGLELVDLRDPETGADSWYLDLEDAPGKQIRSVPVTVTVGSDNGGDVIWLDLPRRGEGYELTFPVGNQCWIRPRRSRGPS